MEENLGSQSPYISVLRQINNNNSYKSWSYVYFLEIWIYQSELIEVEIRLQEFKGMLRVLSSEYEKYQEKWRNDYVIVVIRNIS